MGILEILQEDLRKEGKSIRIRSFKPDMTDTDVMALNGRIGAMAERDGRMLSASPAMAGRYPCSV